MHTFSIQFHGEVDDNKDEQETIQDVHKVIVDSFVPDLLAGVKVKGFDIHVYMVESKPLPSASSEG